MTQPTEQEEEREYGGPGQPGTHTTQTFFLCSRNRSPTYFYYYSSSSSRVVSGGGGGGEGAGGEIRYCRILCILRKEWARRHKLEGHKLEGQKLERLKLERDKS